MENVKLPTGKACEPFEEARQTRVEDMSPRLERQSSRRLITFADEIEEVEKSSSQRSNYKEALSQPAPGLSHRQKMLWLQKRRTSGLWVQCDNCDKWRFQSNVLDRHELPRKWYCKMNSDPAYADCSIPEVPINVREEEDLIHSEYSAGSVVLARVAGWPWWPAMVDDSPDTEEYYWLDGFSDIPTHYNVTFFDSMEATRAWITPDNLKPYITQKHSLTLTKKEKKYKNRLQIALNQADDAIKLPLNERLAKYSFIARYKGAINTPKKVTNKDLVKYQKSLKRKYNIEFPIEFEAEGKEKLPKPKSTKANTIELETPKKNKNDINPISGKKLFGKGTYEENNEKENDTDKTETVDTICSDVFKQPNSMAVQVGSTAETAATETIDNDSSKTYVPVTETEQTSEITEVPTDPFEFESQTTGDLRVRIPESPKSDDFEYTF